MTDPRVLGASKSPYIRPFQACRPFAESRLGYPPWLAVSRKRSTTTLARGTPTTTVVVLGDYRSVKAWSEGGAIEITARADTFGTDASVYMRNRAITDYKTSTSGAIGTGRGPRWWYLKAPRRARQERANQQHLAVIRLQHTLLPACNFCVRKPLQQYFS